MEIEQLDQRDGAPQSADCVLQNFMVLLASKGWTSSYFHCGIDRETDRAMKETIWGKKRMFRLPQQTRLVDWKIGKYGAPTKTMRIRNVSERN